MPSFIHSVLVILLILLILIILNVLLLLLLLADIQSVAQYSIYAGVERERWGSHLPCQGVACGGLGFPILHPVSTADIMSFIVRCRKSNRVSLL